MFGVGVIELLVIFVVFAGVVLALRGGSSARKWVIGGLVFMLFAGVVVAVVGWQVARREQPKQAAISEFKENADAAKARYREQREEVLGVDVPRDVRDMTNEDYRKHLADISRRMRHSTTNDASAQPPAVTAPRPTDKPAAPEWVINPPEDANLQVVVSGQYASKTEARSEASNEAVNLVWKKVHERWHPAGLGGYPNYDEVERRAIQDRHTQKIIRTTDDNAFTVYRSFVLVDTSPSVLASFEKIVEQETKEIRAIQIGIAGIVLTAFVGLIAGFFRIDERTKGRYRWKLIAGIFILGLMSVAFLPGLFWIWTDQSSRPIPPSPVSEGPADEVIIMRRESGSPY